MEERQRAVAIHGFARCAAQCGLSSCWLEALALDEAVMAERDGALRRRTGALCGFGVEAKAIA